MTAVIQDRRSSSRVKIPATVKFGLKKVLPMANQRSERTAAIQEESGHVNRGESENVSFFSRLFGKKNP
ncbi:hypothetical protein TNIN_258371 [Trichonephila inaurata madagascariensis]|uniref:Uncharacterized protein n=1 Tax=Trichonephila inaurata madagascariensis TaxID=2747483 RepID=A0A8X6MIP2_9ARAC|nr:hypothetical protein TNIN_258371 [Trichonephila inaurata madagascariensis]